MRILVFGSRNLTPRHLAAMRKHLHPGKIPIDWGVGAVPTLIHGDGPPGKRKAAIGADKLSTVAAMLEWPSGWKCRTFPPTPEAGETWAAAAVRRNSDMVSQRPDFALCFHTDPRLGRGSADTARKLKAAGLGFRLVLMDEAGNVLKVED